jgi:hypothetical protein
MIASLIALQLAAVPPSTAPGADCQDMAGCYASARQKLNQRMLISYNVDQNGKSVLHVDRCENRGVCHITELRPSSLILGGFGWSNTDQSLQGLLNYANPPHGNWWGYWTLPNGALLDAVVNPYFGFTVGVTAHLSNDGTNQTLFTVSSPLDSQGKPVWSLALEDGSLTIRRLGTEAGTFDLVADQPWDFDLDTLRHSVPPFSSQPALDLFEIYATFRADGKVEIAVFSVNNEEHESDLQISHIQESGWPVFYYPPQSPHAIEQRTWIPVSYRFPFRLIVGDNVLQAAIFDRPLTPNEILAYHAKTAFAGGPAYGERDQINPGMLPCNSGLFAEHTTTEYIETVCGSRAGIRSQPVTPGGTDEPDVN